MPVRQASARPSRLHRGREKLGLAAGFALLAARYWLTVYPHVRAHLTRARARARAISDPTLRGVVLASLAKRSNIEGAAAFAALAPRATRRNAVTALLAFQTIYNYTDVLAEHSAAGNLADARRTQLPLTCALNVGTSITSLYLHGPWMRDTGYLADLLAACRAAIAQLPGAAGIGECALSSAAEIAEFQTHSRPTAVPDELERWARGLPPRARGLSWWETAAACGSSMTVHALIAAAATPGLDRSDMHRIAAVYGGPVGALHSMLDSLIDQDEDAALGQPQLIGLYPSPQDAGEAMGEMAADAMRAVRGLPDGRRHAVLVAAMAGLYLSDPRAGAPGAAPITAAVRGGIGGLAAPAIGVFVLRRLAARSTRPKRRPGPCADGVRAECVEPEQPAAGFARAR
jgi:tetraprenyl-beta-curcumene synthase